LKDEETIKKKKDKCPWGNKRGGRKGRGTYQVTKKKKGLVENKGMETGDSTVGYSRGT